MKKNSMLFVAFVLNTMHHFLLYHYFHINVIITLSIHVSILLSPLTVLIISLPYKHHLLPMRHQHSSLQLLSVVTLYMLHLSFNVPHQLVQQSNANPFAPLILFLANSTRAWACNVCNDQAHSTVILGQRKQKLCTI